MYVRCGQSREQPRGSWQMMVQTNTVRRIWRGTAVLLHNSIFFGFYFLGAWVPHYSLNIFLSLDNFSRALHEFFIYFFNNWGSVVFFFQPTPLLFQSHFHTCPPKHSNKMRKEVSFLLWQLLFSPFHSSPLCSLSHHFHPFQLLKIL